MVAPLVRAKLAVLLAVIAVITTAHGAFAVEVHIVQPGETLSQIASRHGTTVANLQRLNNLPNANLVRYGQRLLIDSPDTTTNAAQGYRTYTVRPGDTLTKVADRHGLSVTTLARINGVSPLRWLYKGQSLLLPVSTALVQPAPAPAALSHVVAANRTVDGVQRYTVQPGDSLTRLAQRHGVTLSSLISMNGLGSAPWLYVGQVLLLPAPAPPQALPQPGRTRSLDHTVHAGETLSEIAAHYRVSPVAILRLNGLTNHSRLAVGQTLRIPSENALELLKYLYPSLDPAHYPTATERWIEVDLGEQLAIAYEGAVPVKVFVISSGVENSPTVTGAFRIWAKIALQDMRGGNRAAGTHYLLKNVPHVQYFYKDYGFHGTYWHSNFGAPMSRGCINMTAQDAEWLFNWTSPTVYGDDWLLSTNANPGTLVMVHQ